MLSKMLGMKSATHSYENGKHQLAGLPELDRQLCPVLAIRTPEERRWVENNKLSMIIFTYYNAEVKRALLARI